jgi:hypothetical protein
MATNTKVRQNGSVEIDLETARDLHRAAQFCSEDDAGVPEDVQEDLARGARELKNEINKTESQGDGHYTVHNNGLRFEMEIDEDSEETEVKLLFPASAVPISGNLSKSHVQYQIYRLLESHGIEARPADEFERLTSRRIAFTPAENSVVAVADADGREVIVEG